MALRDDTTTVNLPGAPRSSATDEDATSFFQRPAPQEDEPFEGAEEATRVASLQGLVPEELLTRDVLYEPAVPDDDEATLLGSRALHDAAIAAVPEPRRPQPVAVASGHVVGPPPPRRALPSLAEVVAGRVPDAASRYGVAGETAAPVVAPPPAPHVAPAPTPAPPTVAAAGPPSVPASAVGTPPVIAAGVPKVFVLVMSLCGVFTLTGVALLAYLKARHLW